MLLMSTLRWILLIGLAVVILAVVFGTKIKDKYFQKAESGNDIWVAAGNGINIKLIFVGIDILFKKLTQEFFRKMCDVFLIASGMLKPKRWNNILAKRHYYLNYGLLGLATALFNYGLNSKVIHGLFKSPEEIISRLRNLGFNGTNLPLLFSVPSFFAVPWASEFCKLLERDYPKQQIYIGGRWVVNNRVDWIYLHIPHANLIVCGTSDDHIVEIVTNKNLPEKLPVTSKGNRYFNDNSRTPKSFLTYELLD